MPWRGSTRATCAKCGRPRQEGELFSARGKCQACGNGTMVEEVRQMRHKQGPYFDQWRRAHAAAVGAVLLDDLPPQG